MRIILVGLKLLVVGVFFVSAAASEQILDISEKRYRANLKILASDEFEGRAPSTKGEEKTIAFLSDQLQLAGTKPGNGDSYLQPVYLVKLATTSSHLCYFSGGEKYTVQQGEDMVAFTRHIKKTNNLSKLDVVFVGHGVVAPEYGWDDYKGIDVEGKIVLMLDNDPGFLSNDKSFFLGKGVTYYSRNSYKYEEAERQGARAAFIIHDKELTKGSWAGLVNRRRGGRLVLDPGSAPEKSVEVEGWITSAMAINLFTASGLSYDGEKNRARTTGFHGKQLNAQMSVSLISSIERSRSNNVIGIIPGVEHPDEYVLYVAHWDHLGRDTSLKGDQIYNGARDNASGTAALLELAHAFKKSPPRSRSVILLAVTAEESGLLGSYYYVQHPLYPLSKTVGVMNMDMMNLSGRTKDTWIHGMGNSPEMDAFVIEAVEGKQGRIAKPFGRPELGIPYRSDSFSFNRSGVPVIGIASGSLHISKGPNYMREQSALFFKHRYHKLADEYDAEMDVSGAIEDITALYLMGTAMANSDKIAGWYDGREFKHLRDAQLK